MSATDPSRPTIVGSIRAQYSSYKGLAEAAIAQMREEDLSAPRADGDNSVAVICWHLSGNLRSRFTDFLTTDGEKPWRRRDEEFLPRRVTRVELLEKWEQGWGVLLATLDGLRDDQLELTITIRRERLRVYEALHRSLAHLAYHVGQIVFIAKASRGAAWRSLSIPLGQSEIYNANPAAFHRP